jgi:hypothetical protein
VPNLLYIFPKQPPEDQDSSSDEEWELETASTTHYDLHAQNRKDKNYQTQTSIAGLHARCLSTGEAAVRVDSGTRELARSQKKWREDSEGQSKYYARKAKEEKSSARNPRDEEVNLSNYNSRKGDRTALNSSKKLIVAEQYSLASQQARTKKVSQAYTLSSRRKNPPRSRLATDHS